MSSAKRQKMIPSRKCATVCASRPRDRIDCAICASFPAAASVMMVRVTPGRSRAGSENSARSRSMFCGVSISSSKDLVLGMGGVGEIGVDDDALDVADDQERRVLQRFSVLEELLIRLLQVSIGSLVLPAEEALLPDVGKPLAAGGLLNRLLEGKRLSRRIKVSGATMPQQIAKVEKMLLGDGTLR